MTIEQLAGEVGMSVRNIRNHHSRGLLQPPDVRARVGYYGPEHVARLRLIQDLQAYGFNLAAIERLLSGPDGLAAKLRGPARRRHRAVRSEVPEISRAMNCQSVSARRAPRTSSGSAAARLLPLGEDRYQVTSPALLRAAEQVMALGISLQTTLQLIERVSRNCDRSHDPSRGS